MTATKHTSKLTQRGALSLLLPACLTWIVTLGCLHLPPLTPWVFGGSAVVGALSLLLLYTHRARPLAVRVLKWGGVFLALTLLVTTHTLGQQRDRELARNIINAHPHSQFETVITGFVKSTAGWQTKTVPALITLKECTQAASTQTTHEGNNCRSVRVPAKLYLPREKHGPQSSSTHALYPGARLIITGTAKQQPDTAAEAYSLYARSVTPPQAAEKPPPTLIAPDQIITRLNMHAANAREELASKAAQTPGAQLVPGFAVGDTSLIDEPTTQSMRATSLQHLLAVSGANCALVIAGVMWVCAQLRIGRRMRLLLAATALAGFCLLVGPDSSVQRAAVMAGVLLAARFGGRPALSLPALGAAIALLLVMDPWQAVKAGFALSVCATAGILTLAPLLTQTMQRVTARFLSIQSLAALSPVGAAVRTAFAVSLAAQLACAPLLTLFTPQVSLVGVFANLLAAPAAAVGTALGLGSLLSGYSAKLLAGFPGGHLVALLDGVVLQLASLPSRWVLGVAEVCEAKS